MRIPFETEIAKVSTPAGDILVEDAAGFVTAKAVIAEILEGWFDYPEIEKGQLFDIGANIGLVSIYVAKCHPTWSVIAVEPNNFNYRMLVANIARNGITNIVPLNYAISAFEVADYKLTLHPSATGGSTHWTDMDNEDHLVCYSSSIRLGKVWDRHADADSEFTAVKMDVEGEEHTIIDDHAGFKWNKISNLHLDTHMNPSLRRAGFSHEQTLKTIRELLNPDAILTTYSIEKGV